jgi:hypothetical protein
MARLGLAIALSGVAIRPFIAAVVNGVISPVLIAAILVVSNDARARRTGMARVERRLAVAGVMALAARDGTFWMGV